MVLAGSIWGTNGLAASLLPAGTSPWTVAAVRTALGGILFVALCRPERIRTIASRRRCWPTLGLAAIGMAAYQACFFAALGLTGMTVTSVVTVGGIPVFTGLIAWIVERRVPTPRWITATGLAVTGGVVLSLATPTGRPVVAGVLCALVAGAGYAVFTTAFASVIRRGADRSAAMAVILLTAAVILSPAPLVWPADWLTTVRGLAVVGYLAGVSTVAAYTLYGRGLRSVPASTASTLILAEPACAAVIGVLVVREPVTARSVVGLVLLTIALLALAGPTRTASRHPALRPSHSLRSRSGTDARGPHRQDGSPPDAAWTSAGTR